MCKIGESHGSSRTRHEGATAPASEGAHVAPIAPERKGRARHSRQVAVLGPVSRRCGRPIGASS
ncbi:hypothetical protein NMD1_02831 [Novosphingobium sp. MD-1]|nr:hypothetical protein NMD1_02831 [Novosphingobium sp. MD-1]